MLKKQAAVIRVHKTFIAIRSSSSYTLLHKRLHTQEHMDFSQLYFEHIHPNPFSVIQLPPNLLNVGTIEIKSNFYLSYFLSNFCELSCCIWCIPIEALQILSLWWRRVRLHLPGGQIFRI